MPELIDEKEAARRLGVEVQEVVYRLEYGQMMGTPKGSGWEIDSRDLEFFRNGERIGKEIVRARKGHPDRGWVMGNCVVCDALIAHPTVPHERWVCGEACAAKAPAGAELRPRF